MSTKATDTAVTIAGPSGDIEAVFTMPAEAQTHRVGIVCHPHSLHGGTMNNKVVTTLVRAFRDRGIPTVRFNFRGVGASAGEFDNGYGEVDDLAAVWQWLQSQTGATELVLAGFSFGSYVSYRFAHRVPPAGLLLIAPPVVNFPFAEQPQPATTTIVVMNDDDDVVDANAVLAWYESLQQPPRLLRYADGGHFFHGQLVRLRDAINEELALLLP